MSDDRCVWCGARAVRDGVGAVVWLVQLGYGGAGEHEHETLAENDERPA